MFCLVGNYAISENFIIAKRILIDAAAVAGVALDGVDNAVFDLLDDTDMIGLTVLRARAALIIPVEEDDHAGRGLHRVICPLPTLPEPLDAVDTSGEFGNDTGVDSPRPSAAHGDGRRACGRIVFSMIASGSAASCTTAVRYSSSRTSARSPALSV